MLALIAFPAISLIGLAVLSQLGAAPPLPLAGASIDTIVLQSGLVFATTLVLGGPLGEELGWRGYLLPLNQRRWSPLVSSLIVGLIWGMWHLPLHLRGLYDGTMGEGLTGIALRLLSSTSLAVLFTWLYNRTRGDLAVMVLLHTSVNNTSGFWLPVHDGVQLVLIPVLVVLVLTDRMYRRLGDPARMAGPSALAPRAEHTETDGTPSAAPSGPAGRRPMQPLHPIRADAEVAAAVNEELSWTPELRGTRITVSVEKGCVILEGQVGTYSQRCAAKRAALRVRGVRDVTDHVSVNTDEPWPFVNDIVADEVRRALKWASNIPPTVTATVAGHTVTLSGTVAWDYERRAAERTIQHLQGVRKVINNITLTVGPIVQDTQMPPRGRPG